MYCRKCGQYIDDDMIFCPRCGFRVRQPKRICYYCKNVLKDNEVICPCCGKNQQIQPTREEDPYKGYWKKPILWIILIALFASAVFVSEYISNNPIEISETTHNEAVKITGKMNDNSIYANNQCEGYVITDGTSIYCVKDKYLYKASLDEPEKMEKIVENCQGYLSLENGKIYFCDTYYNYCSYNIETAQIEKILENVYYPVVVNEKVYYQADGDNESIHCLDLNTKEDKKYNDNTSYDITVDVENEKIYYLSYADGKYSIKRISFNGEEDEKIYDCGDSVSFVLDNQYIYIYDDEEILKINKSSKKKTVIKENLSGGYINICDNKLVYNYGNTIYTMSKKGKDEKEIYSGAITNFQVIGKNVVIKAYDKNYERTIIAIDLNGNSVNLFENSEIEEFEDIEEV